MWELHKKKISRDVNFVQSGLLSQSIKQKGKFSFRQIKSTLFNEPGRAGGGKANTRRRAFNLEVSK